MNYCEKKIVKFIEDLMAELADKDFTITIKMC